MGALHLPNISHFNPSPYLSPWSLCCVSRYILRLPKMSAQNSAGIQTLLDAEKEAQKIVQKAREYRTKRVKDAKTEAQKEIEEYRKRKKRSSRSSSPSNRAEIRRPKTMQTRRQKPKSRRFKRPARNQGRRWLKI